MKTIVGDAWLGYQSRNWPQAKGLVLSTSEGARGESFLIVYKYKVGNIWYQNNVFSFERVKEGQIQVDNLLATYRIGSETKVFYNPSNPQVSCLKPGYRVGFTLLFILPFCLGLATFGAWGLVGLWRSK
jgi:hypothetical protein